MRRHMPDIWVDERGAALIEYASLFAIVAAGTVTVIGLIGADLVVLVQNTLNAAATEAG